VRRGPLVLLVLLAAAPAGCGNERRPAVGLSAEPAGKTTALEYPSVGMQLELPRNFAVQATPRPGVFRATFGSAALSVFAYRRREKLPESEQELQEAMERLETATKERSPSFELSGSRILELGGAPTIGLLGRQTISQSRLRTRSLHVFKGQAEYVIELLAPPREFDRLDKRVFGLIRDSLEITGTVAPTGGSQTGALLPLDSARGLRRGELRPFASAGGLRRGALPPFDSLS